MPSWPPGTPTPTSSSACRSTRGSASRCSRPCGRGSRSSPTPPGRCPRRSATPGILLDSKRPSVVAAAVDRVRRDPVLAGRLAAAGHRRLAAFAPPIDPGPVRRGARRPRPAGGGARVKLAFVTPRYGTEVIGGAETAARMLAERLCRRPGWEVEILTSCALDHLTWENTEPAGTSVLNGVTVHRFPTASRRQLDYFELDARLRVSPTTATLAEARRWVALNGPMCPGLVDAVAGDRRRRGRLLPLPVRHHGGRHRRVQGPDRAPSRPPTTSRPSTCRPSGRASATSTASSTTPRPSGT